MWNSCGASQMRGPTAFVAVAPNNVLHMVAHGDNSKGLAGWNNPATMENEKIQEPMISYRGIVLCVPAKLFAVTLRQVLQYTSKKPKYRKSRIHGPKLHKRTDIHSAANDRKDMKI